VSLLRQRSLLALLLAEIVSTTGSYMTWLAIPWFVLATTGSAARMGIVLATEAAGVALCGIPGSWLAGRLGARRTLIAANGLAAPLVLAVPLLHWAGALSFGVLLALVFGTGAVLGPHFAAQRTVLPEILGEDEARVSEANAFLQAATRTTMLVGPVLAGVLIGVIGAASVLLIDAGTFVFALIAIASAVPAAPRAPLEEGAGDLFAGVRFVARHRLMRTWTLSMAVGDAAWSALFATLPFYAFTRYHENARLAGALMACFGIAAVAGNVLSFRVRRRISTRHLIAYGVLVQALSLWLLVAAGPAWIIAASLLCAGLANGVVNPSLHAMITLIPPPAVRAQALTAVVVVNQIAAPAGYLGAGFALSHLGVMWVFVAVPAVQTLTMGARAYTTLRSGELFPEKGENEALDADTGIAGEEIDPVVEARDEQHLLVRGDGGVVDGLLVPGEGGVALGRDEQERGVDLSDRGRAVQASERRGA
jgi:MFS family permease